MPLRLDPASNRYIGDLLSVSVTALEAMVCQMIEGGTNGFIARQIAQNEASWRPDMDGVQRLSALPPCLYCNRPLPIAQQFCDRDCEAAFHAAACC